MAKRRSKAGSNGHANGSATTLDDSRDSSARAPAGGLRIGGKFYRPGSILPAQYRRVAGPDGRSSDPAAGLPLVPPNFGRFVFPQTISFASRTSLTYNVYRNPDEAVKHNLDNARMMRNDCSIMECVEARERMTALLNWHLEPEDKKDDKQQELVADLTAILTETPNFTEYRRNLLGAIWYGRYAVQHQYGFIHRGGKRRVVVKGWMPINGDKLAFRFDDGTGRFANDEIGIRVGPAWATQDRIAGERKIEFTEFGPAYFFEPWERTLIAVHKHMIEDGTYEDVLSAGRVHGVGVRDRIYWTWFQKQETLAQLMEVIERTGSGFTIYWYPDGNPQAKADVEEIAAKQHHNNVLVMPRMGDPSIDPYGIDRVEANTAGIQAMKEIVHEFFGWQIKRYILGQILSSESAATGLGSGVADLHFDSLMQIVNYDAVKLEETLTKDLVEPLKNWNFPWAKDLRIRFKIDTESSEGEKKLQAFKNAWDMGCRIKASDVMDIIGASMPTEDDEVLFNPTIVQQLRLAQQQFGQDGNSGMGEVPGASGQLEHLFGPLAGLLGGAGDSGQGGADAGGQAPPGGGEPPGGPGGPGGGPPQSPGGPQGSGPANAGSDRPAQYARKQPKSSPGQKGLFADGSGAGSASGAGNPKWREELHPRDEGGQFATNGSGEGGKPGTPGTGQPYLFSDLASKLDALGDIDDSPKAAAKQAELFDVLAKADVPQEQLEALLSGDSVRLGELKAAGQERENSGMAETLPSPEPQGKQPWQMTKKEFNDQFGIHYDARPGAESRVESMSKGMNSGWLAPDVDPYTSEDVYGPHAPVRGWGIAQGAHKQGAIAYVVPWSAIPSGGRTVKQGTIPVASAVVDNPKASIHESLIAKAIADGRQIPPEVLADYPGLKHPARDVGLGDIDTTPPADESEYIDSALWWKKFNDGYRKAGKSKRDEPNQTPNPPIGSWKIDDFNSNYGRMVDQLRMVPVGDLILSEDDYTQPNTNPEGRGDDARRYAEWMGGKSPEELAAIVPPMSVLETDSGKLKVSDGHRRTAAAKLAGVTHLPAWVSPKMDTGKLDSEGKPIYTAMTFEGANGGLHGPKMAGGGDVDRRDAFGEQPIESQSSPPVSAEDEGTAAIAGMPFESREQAQAVARRLEEVAGKHGISGEELWQAVMGEPEGSSSWPLYDSSEDDAVRAEREASRPGREAARRDSENDAKPKAKAIPSSLAKQILNARSTYLSGDSMSSLRQQIASELTGKKVPKSKAGANEVRRLLENHFGIEGGTANERERRTLEALKSMTGE